MSPLGLCALVVDAMKKDDIWFATSDQSVGEAGDLARLFKRCKRWMDLCVAKESPKDQ
jgi:hypothetical protein